MALPLAVMSLQSEIRNPIALRQDFEVTPDISLSSLSHSFQIHQLPSNRGEIANGRWAYESPVRSECVKRSQKELRRFVQAGTSFRDQLLSNREERLQGGFVNRHSLKFSLEGLPYVLQSGLQEFVRRTIVAQDVREKCLVES